MKLTDLAHCIMYRVVSLLLIVLLWGCGGGNNSVNDKSSDRTAAITFQLKLTPTSKQINRALIDSAVAEPDICNDYLIDDIVVEIYHSIDNSLATTAERNCGAHGLTINNVPAGVNLYLVCKGYVNRQSRWQGQLSDFIVAAGETKSVGTIDLGYIGNDQSPPKIISTFPAENATGVDLNPFVAVVFNEPLAPSSISDQAITVLNNDIPVPGIVSYNPDTYTISFTSADGNNFSKETTYTAMLKTQNGNNGAIIDIAGQPFNRDVSWQFTTRGQDNTTAPQIIATSPADGATNVEPQPFIQAIFSEPMEPNSFNDTVFKLSSAQGTVSGQIMYNDQTRTLSLTPDSPLNEATVYTATITTEARDLAQNALLEPYTWQFGIIGPLYSLTVVNIGNGSGTVTSVSPSIDCGNTCQADLSAGTKVALAATADNNSEFTGWSSDYCNSSTGPCSFIIEGNTTITANFSLLTYTINASVIPENGSGGSISPVTATVFHGHDKPFQIQVNEWYHLSKLIVDGSPVVPTLSYLFKNVTENHTIQAILNKALKISDNSVGEWANPQINSDGHVVWSNQSDLRLDIYYYDGTTITNISKDLPGNNTEPQINSNGHVVWINYKDLNREVYYYDGSAVTNISGESHNNYHPQINSNGRVVWFNGIVGSRLDIYYYDGSTATNITKELSIDRNYYPQINANGDVVWTGHNGLRLDIYYYDGSTVTNISKDLPGNNTEPQINLNGHVVWSGSNGSHLDIYYYDGSTVTNITNNSVGNDRKPQINAKGHALWYRFIDSHYEIYYYDGSTVSNIANITNSNPDDDPSLQINSNGHVVWSGNNGSTKEIYYYDGSTVTNISNNLAGDDSDPQINSNGRVVWSAHDGTNNEIYLGFY